LKHNHYLAFCWYILDW